MAKLERRLKYKTGLAAPGTLTAVYIDPGTTGDHGSLAGLGDDDHPQYAALAQAETVAGAWTFNANIALGSGVTIDGIDPNYVVACTYLVLNATEHLSQERVFTPGTGLTPVDGGAGAAYTLNVTPSKLIQGGDAEIDGDKLDIDWNPSNYTPGTAPTEVDSVDHLTAHLYGIDQVLGTLGADLTDETFVVMSASGDLDNERILTSGDGLAALNDGGPGGNVTISLGTPSTLTVSTSNGLTSTSHTHEITTSNNPGANARILASNSSGQLSLQGLYVGISPDANCAIRLYKTGSSSNTYALYADAIATGAMSSLRGIMGLARANGGAVSFGKGVDGQVVSVSTGITDGRAVSGQVIVYADTTITYGSALYADSPSIAGTLTNAYGLYVANITGGAATNYAIYTGTGQVRFGDQARVITTTSPQLTLYYDGSNYATFGISSGGDLTLAPTGDFLFNPTGNDVRPTANYDLNLGTMDYKWLTLHAAELWVETLVSQETIATIGGNFITAPSTSLIADCSSGSGTIDVKHNNIVSGDRLWLMAAGKFEFMAATSGPTAITGGYRYNVTRNLDGTGANQWYAGDAVVNTGQAGSGFIEQYALWGFKAPAVDFIYNYNYGGPSFSANYAASANWSIFGDGANTEVGDCVYFGVANTSWENLRYYIGTAAVYTATLQWQYWNGSTWANFTPTSTTDFKSAGEQATVWTAGNLTGWASTTVNGQAAYWVRVRVNAFTSWSTLPTQVSRRVRRGVAQYGPTIVGWVRNSGTFNDISEKWAIGNLNGLYGIGENYYGIGIGDYSSGDYLLYDSGSGDGFRIKAGGGTTTVNSLGVAVEMATTYSSTRAYKFTEGGSVRSMVEGYIDGVWNDIRIHADVVSGKGSQAGLYAASPATYPAYTTLAAYSVAASNLVNLILTADTDMSPTTTRISCLYATTEKQRFTTNGIQVDGGINVGSIGTEPTDGVLIADSDGRFGGGLYVGATGVDPDIDDIHYEGNLKSVKGGTAYDVFGLRLLATPLTHTSFDGDGKSDQGTSALIDNASWSSTIPTTAKALLVTMQVRDSASATTSGLYFALYPNSSTSVYSLCCSPSGAINDDWVYAQGIVPTTDGDIWWRCDASGSGTLDVYLRVHGYFI